MNIDKLVKSMKRTVLFLLLLSIASCHLVARNIRTSADNNQPMSRYLFAYFTNNTTEGQQVCYATSENGLDFVPLNNGQPVLASEGSTAYPLIGSRDWILCYDCFRDGIFQFCRTQDLQTFTLERTTKTTGVFTPRHGSVIHISEQEFLRLQQAFPSNLPMESN